MKSKCMFFGDFFFFFFKASAIKVPFMMHFKKKSVIFCQKNKIKVSSFVKKKKKFCFETEQQRLISSTPHLQVRYIWEFLKSLLKNNLNIIHKHHSTEAVKQCLKF